MLPGRPEVCRVFRAGGGNHLAVARRDRPAARST